MTLVAMFTSDIRPGLPWLQKRLRNPLFCMRYMLRLKKQLSIEHVIQHTITRWRTPVGEMVARFAVRIKK
jgi:hypothetical protein